jgi:transcriptional regulator with XRE-family HTH domain
MHQKERATLKKFGVRVAQLRTKRSLTQEQLAEATNLDRMTIAFIENGRRWPRLETLLALTSALDVKLSDLFKDL